MTSADQVKGPSNVATGPKQAKHTLSFIIIGAGISGLGAAIALRRAGHHVVLVESNRGLDLAPEHARGLRMTPNMTKIMNRWGYGDRLNDIGVVARQVGFAHFETGEFLGTHQLVRDLVHDAGGEFFLTEHHRFLALLLDIAKELGADVRFGCRVAQIGADCRSVVLESGETLQADVLVGADGILGSTRSSIAPNETEDQAVSSGVMTYCSIIPADRIKADPELLELVTESEVGSGLVNWAWTGEKSAALTFPTSADGDCALFVWTPNDGAGEAWGDTVDREAFSRIVDGLGAEPRLRRLASLSTAVRIKTQSRPHLPDYVHSSKTMLAIGESAHPSLRGLYFGPAMSLEDGAALGKIFSHALEHAQIPSFLDAFSELRRPRCIRMTSIDTESLTFLTVSGSAAAQRDTDFRERHAAGRDAFSPGIGDDAGRTKMLNDNHEIFGYDAEDAADGWWVAWGILRLRAKDSPQLTELSGVGGVAITREEH